MFGKVPGGIPGGKSGNHPGLGDKSALVLCWEETGEKLGITGEKLGIRGKMGIRGNLGIGKKNPWE